MKFLPRSTEFQPIDQRKLQTLEASLSPAEQKTATIMLTPASIEADCATLVDALSTLMRCARVNAGAEEDEKSAASTPATASTIAAPPPPPALVQAVAERLIASAASLAGAAAELRRRAALADVSRRVAAVRASRRRLGAAAEGAQRELDAIGDEVAEEVMVSSEFFSFFFPVAFNPDPRATPQRFVLSLLTLPPPHLPSRPWTSTWPLRRCSRPRRARRSRSGPPEERETKTRREGSQKRCAPRSAGTFERTRPPALLLLRADRSPSCKNVKKRKPETNGIAKKTKG